MAKKISNEQITEVILQNTAEFIKSIESNKSYLNGLISSINVATNSLLENMNIAMNTTVEVNSSQIENNIKLLTEELLKQRVQQDNFLNDFESKIKRGINIPFGVKLSFFTLLIGGTLSLYYNYTFYNKIKAYKENEDLFMNYINKDKTGLADWYKWLKTVDNE